VKRPRHRKAGDRKTTRRSRLDPNQLGLFEAEPATQTTQSATLLSPPTKPVRSAIARKTALRDGPAVLNARDAATYLGVSTSTLKAWRRDGNGPPHTMLGARMIGYRVALLDAWLAARTTDPRRSKR